MASDQVFSHWQQVRRGLLATLDRLSDAELSYVPFKSSWSVAQIALHIGNAEDGWFRFAVRRELSEWPEDDHVADYSTVAAIKDRLAAIHAGTEAYVKSLEAADLERAISLPWGEQTSLGSVIWHVFEHEIHHRGELSLILGLLGREGLDV